MEITLQTFKKGDEIRNFKVIEGKVITSITVADEDEIVQEVFNPTLEQFMNAGWEEYTPDESDSVPTYEDLWVKYKRERYSMDEEFDLLRRKLTMPDEEEVQTEFEEYNNWVLQCQEQARTELGI